MIKKAEFIKPENKAKRGAGVCFMREFDAKNIEKATLYISAHGLYEAVLNGERVGNFVLAPGYTSDRS